MLTTNIADQMQASQQYANSNQDYGTLTGGTLQGIGYWPYYPYWPQPPVQVVTVPVPVVDVRVADLEREVKRLRKCIDRLTEKLDAQHAD